MRGVGSVWNEEACSCERAVWAGGGRFQSLRERRMRMKLSARARLHGAGHRGDAVEGVNEADEGREFQSEVREGAEDAAMAEAFDDFKYDGAGVANGERRESVGAIETCEAAGIKEADVDFGCAVAVVNPVAAGDGAVEVAGGEEEEAAGLEQTGEERDGGGGVRQMLNDLDHTDHIVGRGRLAGDFVEVEDAETVGGFEEGGVGTDVVAGERKRAAGERGALAEKFEEAAGAATEVEPVQGSGGGGGGRSPLQM